MKLFACAIRDKQVEAFLPVFFVRAKGEALRHFMDLMEDKNARFAKHSGDYDLYLLFEFDDTTGIVVRDDSLPFRILSGLDAKASLVQE